MPDFTQKQIDDYIKVSGARCPFCGSGLILVGGAMEVDGSCAWQEASCEDCSNIWTDIYTLTSIERVNDA